MEALQPIHVVPNNDLKPHLTISVGKWPDQPKCICKCNPEHIPVEGGGLVIVHNSYDGREGLEWVNEILKNADQ